MHLPPLHSDRFPVSLVHDKPITTVYVVCAGFIGALLIYFTYFYFEVSCQRKCNVFSTTFVNQTCVYRTKWLLCLSIFDGINFKYDRQQFYRNTLMCFVALIGCGSNQLHPEICAGWLCPLEIWLELRGSWGCQSNKTCIVKCCRTPPARSLLIIL